MQDTPGKGPLRWSLQEARLPRSSPCLREGAKEWAFASSAATCGVSTQGSLRVNPLPTAIPGPPREAGVHQKSYCS